MTPSLISYNLHAIVKAPPDDLKKTAFALDEQLHRLSQEQKSLVREISEFACEVREHLDELQRMISIAREGPIDQAARERIN